MREITHLTLKTGCQRIMGSKIQAGTIIAPSHLFEWSITFIPFCFQPAGVNVT